MQLAHAATAAARAPRPAPGSHESRSLQGNAAQKPLLPVSAARFGARHAETASLNTVATFPPARRAAASRLHARGFGSREATQASEAGPSGASSEEPVAVEVLDKLIEAFRARKRDEWRKMLAVSVEWPNLSAKVFERIKARAAKAEPEEQLTLERLARTLGETDKEISGYKKLFEEFLATPDEEWEALASARRPDLPPAFFDYLQMRIGSLNEIPEEKETQEVLARAAARILALVEAHDEGLKTKQQLEESFNEFQELLKAGSMQEMDTKIDKLVTDGKLTPALMLTTAKMYMSVKESPYVEEEVKDIMAHLYWRMKGSMSQMQPPEVRILKHILSFEDPAERRAQLEEAFVPGPEMATENEDFLSTTPDKLLQLIDTVLEAYTSQQGRATMGGEAAALMTPAVIERMRVVKVEIERSFM